MAELSNCRASSTRDSPSSQTKFMSSKDPGVTYEFRSWPLLAFFQRGGPRAVCSRHDASARATVTVYISWYPSLSKSESLSASTKFNPKLNPKLNALDRVLGERA